MPRLPALLDRMTAPRDAERTAVHATGPAGNVPAIAILPGGVVDVLVRMWDELFRYLVFRTGSAEDADDLMEELYGKALRYQATVKTPEHWLRLIAKRTADDLARRRARLHVTGLDDATLLDPTAGVIHEGEARWAVVEAIGRLTEQERDIVQRVVFDGTSIAALAAILEIEKGAAWKRWQRARSKLAVLLKAEGLGEPRKSTAKDAVPHAPDDADMSPADAGPPEGIDPDEL